jgi:Uma2 family endonuclease
MTVTPTRGDQITTRLPEDELFYPSGDGKPMAENDPCREQAVYCTDVLGHRFADDPMAYIAGNNFIYYEEGNPKKVISPDVYVVFGVEKRLRRSYLAWREGGVLPAVTFEITSAATWAEDTRKRATYEKMGVTEYFQFDPSGDYMWPQLQGYRLTEGRYQRIEAETSPQLRSMPGLIADAVQRPVPLCLRSEVLGLYLVQEGERMRFYDFMTGEPLLSGREQANVEAQRADAEAHRAKVEAQRAEAEAEARIAAERRAEVEAEARIEAEQRAVAEAEAHAQLETEVARLRAELEDLRRRQGL